MRHKENKKKYQIKNNASKTRIILLIQKNGCKENENVINLIIGFLFSNAQIYGKNDKNTVKNSYLKYDKWGNRSFLYA